MGFPNPREGGADGLLAFGGDLTPEWLLEAYASGIFPWFDTDHDPIMWWSPDPRAIFELDGFHVARRFRRVLRSHPYHLTFDQAFADVIAGCASPRPGQRGTWITPRMHRAYEQLHQLGFAHSAEVWRQNELVGGIYGVSLGRWFFAESMFSAETNTSKIALHWLLGRLQAMEFVALDCQLMNPHLASLGAVSIPRARFLERLAENPLTETRRGNWAPYAARTHASEAGQ